MKGLPTLPERRVKAQRVQNKPFVPPEKRKKDRRADWIHIPPGAKQEDLDWLMHALKGKRGGPKLVPPSGPPQPGDNTKKTQSFNPFGHGHTGDPASDVRIQMQDEQDFQHGVQQEHAQLNQDVKDSPTVQAFLGKMHNRATEQERARQARYASEDAARARAKAKPKPQPFKSPLPPYRQPGATGGADEKDQPVIKPRGPSVPGRRNNSKPIGPRPDVAPPMKRPPIPPAPKPIPKRGPLTGAPPLKRPPIPPAPKPKGKDKPFRTPPYKPVGGSGRILTFLTTKPRR